MTNDAIDCAGIEVLLTDAGAGGMESLPGGVFKLMDVVATTNFLETSESASASTGLFLRIHFFF